MNNVYSGNCIRISIDPNEFTSNKVTIKLPDGYSYESIHILYATNISEIAPYLLITTNASYYFPPVRSHSPCTFNLLLKNTSEKAEIRILIEKFGQIPDDQYFVKAFEPIVVTVNNDEYLVIPSDQFK